MAAIRQGFRDAERRNFRLNESDTRSLLITPVLEALGYPARNRMSELGGTGNRPDECLFVGAVTDEQMPVAIFVEAKPLGADFDSSPVGGRVDSPTRQIQRYLRQHPASNLNSIGALTDGFRWRIYERVSETDNRLVSDLNLRRVGHMHSQYLDDPEDASRRDAHELVHWLSLESLVEAGYSRVTPLEHNPADAFFESFSSNITPEAVLGNLFGASDIGSYDESAGMLDLTGKMKELCDNEWHGYAFAYGPALALTTEDSSQRTFSDPPRLPVAAVHFTPGSLARADMAMSVRAFSTLSADRSAVAVAYARPLDEDRAPDEYEARVAVSVKGRVSMTPQFALQLPVPSARIAVADILNMMRNAPDSGIDPATLAEPLGVQELQQRFYLEVAGWVERHQLGREKPHRQAVLQHLIKVMFAWILKETNQLPSAPFEVAYVRDALDDMDRYHEDVLEYLFHERLNVEPAKRQPHPNVSINAALDSVPYLNGSLFMRNLEWDGLVSLSADDYWSPDTSSPGLFTILSRYHWTLDENRPGVQEQTLDPELLSNLFERLITPTNVGPERLKSMPGGTYYTPPDVTDEMVKDALCAAVSRHAPNLAEHKVRGLFDSGIAGFRDIPVDEGKGLVEPIKSLEIFDPAVGSGAFLFSALVALKTAISKLGDRATAEEIIGRQLFGQDVQPLAVQITKLRLFIAIQSERTAGSRGILDAAQETSEVTARPLPNLEARVICADTLATSPTTAWSPFDSGQLDGADETIKRLLADLADLRLSWYNAHAEEDKMAILDEYADARASLRAALQSKGELASPSLMALADAKLLSSRQVAIAADPRLLFYSPDRKGFDVVVGNPPYEKLYVGLSDEERSRAIAKLTDEMGYRTTRVNNLYSLFCEVGLALASDNGVVTMVMPHSIAFGDRQRGLRRLFESRCARIDVRHYDNRPDTVFSSSPMVRSPENRQRATILTATIGSADGVRLRSTGLMRWSAFEREECLASRSYYAEVRSPRENGNGHHGDQWSRIPTEIIAGMVAAMGEQEHHLIGTKNGSNPCLAIPQTAYQYLSVVPVGGIEDRSEITLMVNDSFDFRLAMAAINSHAGFAWWLIYGDGFHVKQSDFRGFGIPDEWIASPDEVVGLGQELIDAIPDCSVENRFQGKTFRNVDFHSGRPDLIEQIDQLYITALGLPEEPLLSQLRVMRSNSSWRYGH